MTADEFARCAARISAALKLESGERVLIKLDVRTFAPLVEPLQTEIRRTGAILFAAILAEDTNASTEAEYRALKVLFDQSDVFIWLPELNQGSRPGLARALVEWLDAKRGRAVHFHWHSGSYPLPGSPLPDSAVVDSIYVDALDADPNELDRRHRSAIALLRSQEIRVTTPDGTDMRFHTGDRPFCSQTGDAGRTRMLSAVTRIDRDIELPAGVLRIAPIEESANGTMFLPVWRPLRTEGRGLMLEFHHGYLRHIAGVNGQAVLDELHAAGGAARMFREFALGFNDRLAIRSHHPFIAYYGYGSGVVRMSLGDNEEMGGANRGGGVYWNFIPNADVSAGSTFLVRSGKLQL